MEQTLHFIALIEEIYMWDEIGACAQTKKKINLVVNLIIIQRIALHMSAHLT